MKIAASHWKTIGLERRRILRGIRLLALTSLLAGCSFERHTANSVITLEVACFEGGYGLDWHRSVARRYEQLHPNIKVNLWGDSRVDDKIKPRVLRGSPPDLASCSLPIWKLIVAGKLYPLDETLASPAYGKNATWRETLTGGILSDFSYQGKTYAIPSNLGAWVCWYDKRMFRQHGWEPPRTWGEFVALCEKMQAANIAPLAFQGKYPIYAWFTLIALYQRLVPFETWYAMQDLKPGAFLDPAFVRTAALIQQMATKHYEKGAMGMTHTDSQREWVNGKAAMVYCGLWLKNEMKDTLPPEFEMSCFAVPSVEEGKGDPKAVYGGGAENFFVFSQAKHPREAADFLKFMLSMEPAQDYVQRLDTLSPVKDSSKGLKVSSALDSAVKIINARSRIFSDRLNTLYLEFGKVAMPDALAELLKGNITPEVFAQRLEASAEKIRKDPEVYKPPARGVPQD